MLFHELWKHSQYWFPGRDRCCAHEVQSVQKGLHLLSTLSSSLGHSVQGSAESTSGHYPKQQALWHMRARRPWLRSPPALQQLPVQSLRMTWSQFTVPCLSHCSGQQRARECSPGHSDSWFTFLLALARECCALCV